MPPYNRYRGRGRGGSYNPMAKPTYSRPTPTEPCVIYTRTGRCDSGRSCRYAHIPERRALCMSIFKTGRCSKAGSDRCFLSHKSVPQNTPMCKYFADGRCSNGDECKFVHMTNLDPPVNGKRTPVCRSFALNGWCDRGKLCNKRHSFDCPDFESHGKCVNPKCTLQHVILDTNTIIVPEPSVSNGIDQQVKLADFIQFIDFLINEPQKANDIYNADVSQHPVAESADYVEESNETSNSENDSDRSDDSDGVVDLYADDDGEEVDVNADFIKV